MYFSLPALFTASIFSRGAPNTITTENRDDANCSVYARSDGVWLLTGNMMSRRRVVYDTDKVLYHLYDEVMYEYGWKWEDLKSDCNASTESVQVYYHGVVIPGGAYVVDSNDSLGISGDAAYECMLDRFRELLVRELKCTLDTAEG